MFVLIARQLDRVPGLERRTGAQSAKWPAVLVKFMQRVGDAGALER